jgi:signal transduction histidine kinase
LGVGIAGMRERLREMRGSLELISDRGTTVRAVIPIGGETWQN